jgi:hypothetical protein
VTAPAALAQAPAVPVPAAQAPGAPEGEPLRMDLGPERPIPTPPPLRPGRPDPTAGVQFGLGFPVMDVQAEALGVQLRGGKLSETGVLMHVEVLWEPFRLGYARQLYRTDLPAGTTLDGNPVDALRFDADQLWGFHGWRPHHRLYLGYGLGLQRRVVRVQLGTTDVLADSETILLAGLLAEWAVGPPYVLQVRVFRDLQEGFLLAQGLSLQLGFTAAF